MKTLFVLSAFALIFSTASAAQFKFGAQTLTVPDGFEVELVAAPPLINRPVSMSFDERGRLYVTDSAGMTGTTAQMLETKPHRVVRLDAANENGRFEKSALFADKMMFPEGCLWYEGSLYVAAPPQIWKLTDTDGDGVADKREAWLDAKTLTHCANDLHGPYLGRDGWFYWCKGAFAEQTYTLPNGKPFTTRASHIFRAHPDGTGIEPVLTGGMDNPVGVAFNSVGERFLSCTFFQNPAGGKRDGLIHAIYGGVYGKIHNVIEGHKMTGGVMPVLTNFGAAAPCGLICYDSAIFGKDYRDNLFTCCFNLHKIINSQLFPDGATYKTIDTDFLSSDSPDFHPTDVLEDADGSLLVADTGGWYKVCCPTSQLAKPEVLGAIYRVRKTGAKTLDDPRGLKIAWDKLVTGELVKLLGDERVYVQRRAIHALGKRNDAGAAEAIGELIEGSASEETKRNGIWALARMDCAESVSPIRDALLHTATAHAAAHAASVANRVALKGALITCIKRQADRGTIRAAVEALGRIGGNLAAKELLQSALIHIPVLQPVDYDKPENPAERILEHSYIYALIEIGDASYLNYPMWDGVLLMTLIARDQMEGGNLGAAEIIDKVDAQYPPMKAAAVWIMGHHPEWGEKLAEQFANKLNSVPFDDLNAARIESQLTPLIKSNAIQELIAQTALKATDNAQLVALRVMLAANLKDTPASWINAVNHALTSTDGKVLTLAVAAARSFPPPKKGTVSSATELAMLARKTELPDALRLNALAAAGNSLQLDAPLFHFLLMNIELSKPPADRNAAATALSKASLSPEQLVLLAGALKADAGPMEVRALLTPFERGSTDDVGLALLDALKNSKHAKGLRAEVLRPIFAKFAKSVQDAAAEWLTSLAPNSANQAAHLDDLLKKLPTGDVQRGHVVFHSTKTACTTCHATGYLGGTLGPDLTSIGKARNERDLLEAVIYPSASFVRSYEPYSVRTVGGERFNGILKKDAPDEVVLAIDPKTEKHIPRAEIAKLEPGTVSVMPEGMEAILTPQELADLIAFLKASK